MHTDVNYEELIEFYSNIICIIYDELQNHRRDPYPTEVAKMALEKKYKDAYGVLDKASWRMDYVCGTLDHKDDKHYYYFAMEPISEARDRINFVVNNIDYKFPKEVMEYTKYDDILDEYRKIDRKDGYLSTCYKYYQHMDYIRTAKRALEHDKKHLADLEATFAEISKELEEYDV